MPEVVPGLLRGVSEGRRAWRRAGRTGPGRREAEGPQRAAGAQREPPFGDGEILAAPVAPIPPVSAKKAPASSGPAAEAPLRRECLPRQRAALLGDKILPGRLSMAFC